MEKKIIEKIEQINNCILLSKIDNNKLLSISSGEIGKLMYTYNYSQKFKNDEFNEFSTNTLSFIFDNINEIADIRTSFIDGISGFYWFMSFYNKKYFDLDASFFNDIDSIQILVNSFNNNLSQNNYDYLHGAFGQFLALEELNVFSKNGLDAVIKNYFLEEKIPYFIQDNEQVHNLGLAHGIPSLISILSISKLNNSQELITPLINYLDVYYKKYIREKTKGLSIFPHFISKNTTRVNDSRLAWCYGDIGIAISFWNAGKIFSNIIWKQTAIDILLHSTKRRDLAENAVVDAGICHGTAGLAHIYNRFYKETSIKEFDEARWYWLNETLKMANFEDGLAGYKAWQGQQGWQNEYGLLEGIAGIGLVLLGFLTDDIEDLSWDRCLLLS